MKDKGTVWSNYDYGKCLEDKPSNEELFKYDSTTKNNYWEKSLHPWCGSCYNSYVEICSKVADDFNLYIDKLGHWDKNKLSKAINNFILSTAKEDPKEWLNKHEQKIINIIECINLRHYHGINCYKVKATSGSIRRKMKYIIDGEKYGEKSHIDFLKFLCKSLLKLFITYEKNLKYYNDHYSKKEKPNILTMLNPITSGICTELFNEDKGLKELVKNSKYEDVPKNKLKYNLSEDYNISLEDTYNIMVNKKFINDKNEVEKILARNNINKSTKNPKKRKSKRKSKR